METKKRKQMRREYYIYREIQLKYIRLCLLLMVLVCLIMTYTIQETWGGLIVKKLSLGFINSTLILRLLIMIPVIVVATMYLSNRVAGPVFRLEKDLVEISRGDLSRRIVLRKTDDLKKLAAEINRFIHRMDAHLSTLKSGLSKLHGSVTRARQEGVGAKEIEPRLKEWADSLDKMAQELSHFKTSS